MTDAERWFRERFSSTPEREALFTTLSGEPVEPLYTPEDVGPSERIGFPGDYPFTRGVYPSMYRGRLWTMRQFAGFGTSEETNERFRYLRDQMIAAIEGGGMREYYAPESGRGLGARDFAWTAALCLHDDLRT